MQPKVKLFSEKKEEGVFIRAGGFISIKKV